VATISKTRSLGPIQLSGEAYAIGHHGELVQGVFEDDQCRLHRGLVTLPLDRLRSTVRLTIDGSESLVVEPADRIKARSSVLLTLEQLGWPATGGHLSVKSNIPVGHGYGSSTADVVASIRAVATALGTKLPPSSISRLAVAAEIAADATAFETEAVLFAQREGEVLEHFGGALPPFILLGFKANGIDTVDTLDLPAARYDLEEIQQFRGMRAMVARAVQHQDLPLLARAATLSAIMSQHHFPKPCFEFVTDLLKYPGVLGLQVAHSGTLYGLLFDPRSPVVTQSVCAISVELENARFHDIGVFQINGAGGLHVH
jgi:uncharacterized protein involved in propanediol utilization